MRITLSSCFCLFLVYSLSYSQLTLENRIDSTFHSFNNPHSPGCIIGIIKNGQLQYSQGYGMADVENKIPFTTKTNFDLASNSKQFTAMCILLLAEEGKLNRTDDIRKYIPEMPDYGFTITIDNLLYHTSGIRDYLSLFHIACLPNKYHTKKNMLNIITAQKQLNFQPGSNHLYSNSNYFLLGIIVERVSKTSFHKYIRQHILNPLGMDHTFFSEEKKLKNETASYLLKDSTYTRSAITNIYYYGDGGMLSNIDDLCKWDQNFYHNVLGKKNQDLIIDMQKTTLLNNGNETYCAAGLFCYTYKGLDITIHGGAYGSFTTQWIRFPQKKLTIICLANTPIATLSYCFAVADLLLKDQLTPDLLPETSMNSFVPGLLPGFYYNEQTASYHTISLRNNELWMDMKKYQRLNEFEYIANDSWHWKNNLSFNIPNNGPITMRHQVAFADDTYSLILPDTLKGIFIGTYISAELNNMPLELRQENGNYVFIAKKKYTANIEESFGNKCLVRTFNCLVEFDTDSDGAVLGLYLSNERVKRLYFKKQ